MDNFMEILTSNDQEELKKYLSMNGKKKPVSPVFFEKEYQIEGGNKEDERTIKHAGTVNRNQGTNEEVEISK